ncbi:MAG: hypothetical protein WC451_06245 [Patescibacteria group bacterium]
MSKVKKIALFIGNWLLYSVVAFLLVAAAMGAGTNDIVFTPAQEHQYLLILFWVGMASIPIGLLVSLVAFYSKDPFP